MLIRPMIPMAAAGDQKLYMNSAVSALLYSHNERLYRLQPKSVGIQPFTEFNNSSNFATHEKRGCGLCHLQKPLKLCTHSPVNALLSSVGDRQSCVQTKPDVVQQFVNSNMILLHARRGPTLRRHLRPLVSRRTVCKASDVQSEERVSSKREKIARKNSTSGSLVALTSALRFYFKEVESTWETIGRDPNPASAVWRVLAKEWKIVYLLMCSDVTGVLPFCIMGANILIMSGLSRGNWGYDFWNEAATTMGKEALYSFLYLHCFNLANQYVGVKGDAVDKPWRPIPAGLLHRQSCLARCFLANVLYDFVSWQFGVLHLTIIWQGYIAAQFLGAEKDDRGMIRSLGMWLSVSVGCLVAVSLAHPMNLPLFWWAMARGAMFGNNHWVQDFRDVKGDMKIGRKTFPIIFGLERARKLMAFILLMDPIFMHFVVLRDSAYTAPQLACELVAFCLSAAVAYRLLNFKAPQDDHDTYTIWHILISQGFTYLAIGPGLLLFSTSPSI